MAETNQEDQGKPLAPLSLTTRSDQPDEDQYKDRTKHVHSRTKVILCCGFIASITMLIAVIFIVLSLTVFHLRNPNLNVNSISFIQPLGFVNGKVNTTRNATVLMEISLRNPNPAVFKVKNVTVLVYNGELVVVGKSNRRSETIPAKRTAKMNLTAEIVTAKLLASVPGLMENFNGRGVDLNSSVEVHGKVKIMKIFKKSVQLKTNCSMTMMLNNSLTPTFHCWMIRNAYEHI